MWNYLKKTAFVLWHSAKNNRSHFFMMSAVVFGITCALLAGPLSFAAIPVALAIALFTGTLLTHGLQLLIFYLEPRKRVILVNYADKLTEPQEALYNNAASMDLAVTSSLGILPTAVQDIVFSYFKSHRMLSSPAEFKQTILSFNINNHFKPWFKRGSLNEFIKICTAMGWSDETFTQECCPVAKKEAFLHDLLQLKFNEQIPIARHEWYELNRLRGPIHFFSNTLADSFHVPDTKACQSLLKFAKANLEDWEIEHIVDSGFFCLYLQLIYNPDKINIDLFLGIFAAQEFSTTLYDAVLCNKNLLDKYSHRTLTISFFSKITSTLILSEKSQAQIAAGINLKFPG